MVAVFYDLNTAAPCEKEPKLVLEVLLQARQLAGKVVAHVLGQVAADVGFDGVTHAFVIAADMVEQPLDEGEEIVCLLKVARVETSRACLVPPREPGLQRKVGR